MKKDTSGDAYWKANMSLVRLCMIIWFVCSFGMAILLRPWLQGIRIGGADLGFWMAQQGSIYVFIALIFYYAWRMNKIDQEFGVDEE